MTESAPAISLVLPAWNEEKYIEPTLDSVGRAAEAFRRERGLDVEVIVVDNGSTDRTAGIAASRGCRVVSYTERHQMASVRNAGAREARAPIIAFVDADRSIVPAGVFREIYDNLQDPAIFGGGSNARPERWTIAATAFIAVVKTYMWIRNIGAVMFYLRRADFEALGGFNEEYWAAEDLEFALRMRDAARSRGGRFRNLKGAVTICQRKEGMVPVLKILKLALLLAFRPSVVKDPGAWAPVYYDVDRLR